MIVADFRLYSFRTEKLIDEQTIRASSLSLLTGGLVVLLSCSQTCTYNNATKQQNHKTAKKILSHIFLFAINYANRFHWLCLYLSVLWVAHHAWKNGMKRDVIENNSIS